ncbi:MAG TPA: cupin domain-containing protein [Candidatus Sulfomarinibacteraceae bacterium]|nr:cupin domain-containing protein [Candidatus Sulfomarinibacteraceae bacterium]
MAAIEGGGIVLLRGQGRQIDEGSFVVGVLADGELTDGAFSLIETTETEVGTGPPLHIHRDCAESFVVLAGRYRMHLGGHDLDCPSGSFVYVPKGLVHTFVSVEPGSRKLNLYTPAGMVGYFDELADAIRKGVSAEDLGALAERYAMEVVGPVPEGYLSSRP